MMKSSILRLTLTLGLLLIAAGAFAQTTIDNTTINAAMTINQTTVSVASATCTTCTIANGTLIYVDFEAMRVTSTTASTTVFNVTRGTDGTAAQAHNNGAVVFLGPATRFHANDPVPNGPFQTAGCTTTGQPPNGYGAFKPWISLKSGIIWGCDNVNWDATLPFVIRTTRRTS